MGKGCLYRRKPRTEAQGHRAHGESLKNPPVNDNIIPINVPGTILFRGDKDGKEDYCVDHVWKK